MNKLGLNSISSSDLFGDETIAPAVVPVSPVIKAEAPTPRPPKTQSRRSIGFVDTNTPEPEAYIPSTMDDAPAQQTRPSEYNYAHVVPPSVASLADPIESFGLNGSCTMEHADATLKAAGVNFYRPSKFQIKCGRFNFYPTSGKITVDGVGRVAETGLDNFLKAVKPSR